MGPKLPTIGVGQKVSLAVEMLDTVAGAAGAVGRPAARRAHPHRPADATSRPSAPRSQRWVSSRSRRAGASRPAPSTPARQPDPATGAVVTPITLSARRSPRTASASTGASSTRAAATRRAPRSRRASRRWKARAHGLAFASGLAAEDNVLRLLRPGDRVAARQRRLRRHVPADLQGVGTARAAVDARSTSPTSTRSPPTGPTTRAMVWLETPTNPLLTCIDIEAVAARRPRPRRAGRRRQHVRHAVPAAAAGARRRHRRALGHQVPRRPQRCGRRVPRRSTTTSSPIGCASRRTRPAPCRRRSTATSCCAA